LSYVAEDGNIDIVKLLIESHGADVNSRDEDGRTPLGWAREKKNVDVANFLIDKGGNSGNV